MVQLTAWFMQEYLMVFIEVIKAAIALTAAALWKQEVLHSHRRIEPINEPSLTCSSALSVFKVILLLKALQLLQLLYCETLLQVHEPLLQILFPRQIALAHECTRFLLCLSLRVFALDVVIQLIHVHLVHFLVSQL